MNKSRTSESATLADTLASENLPHFQGMGRRQRRAAETRVRLFRCALQLFAERGFPNVTVEDITEAADVGKGTFFNYFESKDHVLGVMAEIQLGKVREAVTLAESGKRTIYSVLHQLFLRIGGGAWTQPRPGPRPDLFFSGQRERSSAYRPQHVRRPQDGRPDCGRGAKARRDRLSPEERKRSRFSFSRRSWGHSCFGRCRASQRLMSGWKKAFNTFGGRSPSPVKSRSDEMQFSY